MVLYLGEPARRFLLYLHFIFVSSFQFLIFILLLLFFISQCTSFHLLFDIIPHFSVDYRRVFTPILYFQLSPSQNDSRHFHFQPFRDLLTVSPMVLSERFLPTGAFYLTLLHWHFWVNLRLSRLPWKPEVLPWSLQGFILILETRTRPICLFDSE